MVKQCTVILGCWGLGELLVYLLGIKLPGCIIGMLLLAFFLYLKWIKLSWVKGVSDFLLSNMGFFFVSPGVALMLYFDLIKDELLAILLATLVSTIIVLSVSGLVYQIIVKRRKR